MFPKHIAILLQACSLINPEPVDTYAAIENLGLACKVEPHITYIHGGSTMAEL
jgi:hypothetical protein